MKIKCPLCGCENYFTGLEDEGTKFCSECNTPLVEPKTMLDKETFCPYCGIELIEKYKGKYKNINVLAAIEVLLNQLLR